jgi:TolB-like protein/tetratricopeptide (TPR) repeat protein
MQGSDEDQRVISTLANARQPPPEQRDDSVRGACAHDSDLSREVIEGLRWEERIGSFLQKPLLNLAELARPFQAGEVISERFEIVREIGVGGMGVVYEAFDRKRKLRIAIKAAKPGFQCRLSPELEGALQVRHHNICLVNEIHTAQTKYGEIDFLTMELLEGETLRARLLRGGRLSCDEALNIICQVCAGLRAAHDSELIHRDLKSANIILSQNSDGSRRAVITDFGLASGLSLPSSEMGGTPAYMAPELWKGEKASKASDIYALGIVMYEMVTGSRPVASNGSVQEELKRRPASPSTSVQGLDSRWDSVILQCLDPSPHARPESATEIAARLRERSQSAAEICIALEKVLGERSQSPAEVHTALEEVQRVAARRYLRPAKRVAVVSLAVLLAAACVTAPWWWRMRIRSNSAVTRKVIAVLPFSNEGAGPDFDYLRYAIASDLVTDLTYARSISVRPFCSTSKYAAQSPDPAVVGRELRVTHMLAGGFMMEKQNLRVNLELVDVAQNQPVWREEVTVSAQDLVKLHDQLSVRVAEGMLASINVGSASPDKIPAPKNEQAFELFQHSLGIPLDPQSNLVAIKKLEESISLDSGYASAWGELGVRYYVDLHYGSAQEDSLHKSMQAFRRQSKLDPNTPPVWTFFRVEQGDLNGAYDQASMFLRRHPDSSMAHFGMSYVLRYAGLLDDARKECDAALALDPGFNGLRSCALPLIREGDYTGAEQYITLDEGFGALMRGKIALRRGKGATALAEYDAAAKVGYLSTNDAARTFLRACLNHAPQAELDQATAKLEADPVSEHDPELWFDNAELLCSCSQRDAALRLLKKSIKGGNCSYPAMNENPLFDAIRQRPEFGELRQAGLQCQQNFMAHRAQVDAALRAR